MQICTKCGADIKYIATGYNTWEMCSAERVEIITESGRRAKGYLLHKCKETKNDEQKDNSDN